jgi:hypothetical protein
METTKSLWKALSAVRFLMLVVAAAPAAHAAGFVLNPGGTDLANSFQRSFQYFFGAGGVTPLVNGANWITNLTDAAGAGGAHNLTVTIQHQVPAPAGPLFTFNFPGLTQPALGAVDVLGQAAQLNHGTATDLARATVSVRAGAEPPSAATVITSGVHVAAGGTSLGWSLSNPAGNPALTAITVTPSYREVGTGNTFNGPVTTLPGGIPAGGTASGTLPAAAVNPANGALGRLADYRVQAFGSGNTETTLAYIGQVNGMLDELDLGSATSLFMGFDEFLAPMFSRSSGGDLFVYVDLTQWLSAPSSFLPTPGEVFSIIGGTSSLLPGFLFSTSTIDFVPGTGLVTASPLNGENVFARAVIDGQTVPEPSTLAFLSIGVLLVLGYRLRRGSKRENG